MIRNVTPSMVSVIVPTYNAEAYLAETMASVLEQNWEPLELLVVDDGSSDRTVAVAKGFGDLADTKVHLHPHAAFLLRSDVRHGGGQADVFSEPGTVGRRAYPLRGAA